jgi:3-oxoacyl-[acyl-carrier protein] reductase
MIECYHNLSYDHSMDFGLQDKTVLVAAASQGLGKAIAAQFVAEGAEVYICARDTERLAETAQEIGAKGVSCDVARPEQIVQLTETIGKIDILVTNAGGPKPGTTAELNDTDWQQTFDLTFMSAVRLIRGVLPQMQKQQWGRIICLTSTSVQQPIERLTASNAIRAAVANLAKSLANEVGKDGITVNVIAPGMFDTARMQQLYPTANQRSQVQQAIPTRRFGDTNELAAAVVFLASQQAAYINGVLLPVDGGLTKSL